MEMTIEEIVTVARELALMNYNMGKQIDRLEKENKGLILEMCSLQARLEEALGVVPEYPTSDIEVTVLAD